MNLFSNSVNLLEKGLEYSSLKQKVIAQNIANADTPNYKAKDVKFSAYLDGAIHSKIESYRTDARHYEFESSSTRSAISVQNQVNYNSNGNSVDMDKEMSDQASNQIYYNALVERLSGNFRTLESVIRGGK